MSSIDRYKGDRWRARWRDPDGKSRSEVFSRKEDARSRLLSVDHSKATSAYVDPALGQVPFRRYAEEWRTIQLHRTTTATSAEQQLRSHVYPVIGDRPIAAIRTSEVQALVHRLGESLAPSTSRVVYGRVVAVFASAVRDRVIAVSPCSGVKAPSAPPAMLLPLTTGDVLAQAEAVPPRYRALVLTGAGSGLRPGELYGLTVDRVDFLRKAVRVDRQLVRFPDGLRLAPLKTRTSYRTVPLGDSTVNELARHLAAWPAVDGFIFTNQLGAPIQKPALRVAWAKAREKAGIPAWATPHDLRHYYASLLIAKGASVKVVQARLGHASAKTTLDLYSHLWPDSEDVTRFIVDAELTLEEGSRVTDVSRSQVQEQL